MRLVWAIALCIFLGAGAPLSAATVLFDFETDEEVTLWHDERKTTLGADKRLSAPRRLPPRANPQCASGHRNGGPRSTAALESGRPLKGSPDHRLVALRPPGDGAGQRDRHAPPADALHHRLGEANSSRPEPSRDAPASHADPGRDPGAEGFRRPKGGCIRYPGDALLHRGPARGDGDPHRPAAPLGAGREIPPFPRVTWKELATLQAPQRGKSPRRSRRGGGPPGRGGARETPPGGVGDEGDCRPPEGALASRPRLPRAMKRCSRRQRRLRACERRPPG